MKSIKLSLKQKPNAYDKLMSLGLFVSGTAQEIKYPLKAVLQHLEKLLAKYQRRGFEYISFKEFSEIIRTIEKTGVEIKHCCDILEKLIALNKKQSGLFQKNCNVNNAISDVLYHMMSKLKLLDIYLASSLAENLPLANIDSVELEYVLTNLISNAVQSMPAGGKLTIKTGYNRSKKVVEIEIKDTGVGISRENMSRIFEPFFSTKKRVHKRNLGLGLSVAQSIINKCNGNIHIKSNLRQGTSVLIALPATKKSSRL